MASKFESVYYRSPVWLQNLAVTLMGYRLYQKRYTGVYHEVLDLVRRSRTWSSQQKDDYQSEQLHKLIRHCRLSVPFYQRQFAEYGIHENDITSINDLHKLPLLDKQTVRTHLEDFRAPGVPTFMLQNTSGSTGTPLTLSVDERTYKMAMALLVEHEEYHGVPFGARRATFAGRMVQQATNMSPPFARTNRAENQRLYSSYHLNETSFPWYRDDLDRFAPAELIGYPSAICELASFYQNSDSAPTFRPEAIVTNSETLLAWQREKIESVFACKVRDYYGTAEYVLFAGQDQEGIYRCNPAIGVTELIRDLPQSDTGNIVATTLTNYAMPLIRYDIGDTATGAPSPVRNGTRVDSFSSIDGRKDDYIQTPDGRRIGRIDHIFKGVTGVKEAQVVQDNPTHCLIRVVTDPENGHFDEQIIIDNLLSRTGPDLTVTVEQTDKIPRGPNGKFKSVVSLNQ